MTHTLASAKIDLAGTGQVEQVRLTSRLIDIGRALSPSEALLGRVGQTRAAFPSATWYPDSAVAQELRGQHHRTQEALWPTDR